MKYLKKIQNINKPEVDDYVVVSVKVRYSNFKPMYVIGQITSIVEEFKPIAYIVRYTLPDGKTSNEVFYKNDLKDWSKNKKDLEYILNANKYNL